MGDPFSVAGTTVGIISLGIQTCQILSKHCSDFKNFPLDVEVIQRQIKGLQGILEGLYEVKERLEIDIHVPSSQLNMALKQCEETLHELKGMAEKRNPTSPSEKKPTKVRVLKERALWSYRKEDLKELQSSLARFQNNLSLALQCAGLDGALRRLDDVRTELDVQREQAIRIEQTLNQGTEVLKVIRKDVASQNPALSTIYNEIIQLRTQLLESNASRTDSYSLSDSSSSSRELIFISSGMDVTRTHSESLESPYRFTSRQHRVGTRTSYSCRCRSRRKHDSDSRGWYKIVIDETYDHSKDCPQSKHGDYTRSVAVQLFMFNSLLRFCVQIGWQRSKRGGWNSPAPVLRYRAVVSRDSPVFNLINLKKREISDLKKGNANSSEISAVLPTTALQLRQTFGKDASPTDLDEHGNGILHAVLTLIQHAIRTDFTESALSELINVCFEEGVPFDEPDAYGDYPITFWQLQTESPGFINAGVRKGELHTLFHLTQKVKSWSITSHALDPNYYLHNRLLAPVYCLFFDCVSDLLKLESCSEGLDEDDPILEAILRRSECDFIALMTAHEGDFWTFYNFGNIYALPTWPQGINIMFSHFGKDVHKMISERLLDDAVASAALESIKILLEHGVSATQSTWKLLADHFSFVRLYESDYFLEQDISEEYILSWSNIPDIIASRIERSRETITTCCGHNDIVPRARSLYHPSGLTYAMAESAWRTGHRGLNSVSPVAAEEHSPFGTYATPLWVHSVEFTAYIFYSKDRVKLLMWLIRHGADPLWIHSTHLTTPAHLLARRLFALTLLNDEYRADTCALLSSELRDSCYCPCSRSGCRVIGCAVAKQSRLSGIVIMHEKDRDAFKNSLKAVFKIVKNKRSNKWMAPDILRVMTFEKLSLTHTCCHPLHDPFLKEFVRPSPEEMEEIHHSEQNDISLLEEIVAELEDKWASYNKSFLTFMNRVWRPRMRKMREDRKADKASYQAQLVQMGIIVEETDQERDSDAESYGSWSGESEDADSEGWYTTDEEADEA